MLRYLRMGVLILLLWPGLSYGQEALTLGTETFVPVQNMLRSRGGRAELQGEVHGGRRNVLVQFSSIPSPQARAQWEALGLELGDFLGANAYWAQIRTESSLRALATPQAEGVRLISVMEPRPEWKLPPHLVSGEVPPYAQVGISSARVHVRYAGNASPDEVVAQLQTLGMRVVHHAPGFGLVTGDLPLRSRAQVAALPYVLALGYVESPFDLYNGTARAVGKANALVAPAELMGRGLTGRGTRVGVWDADVTQHPDFGRRVEIVESQYPHFHGTHVTGSVLGSGLLDPRYRGMAPGTRAWTANFAPSLDGTTFQEKVEIFHRKRDISLTQNSWGEDLGVVCRIYRQLSYSTHYQLTDELSVRYPTLLHVFSAGNEQGKCPGGTSEVHGLPRYGTVTNRTKNTLLVGAVDRIGRMTTFSSFGPQDDGRIAPTVCAMGEQVVSTMPDEDYMAASGTSMSAPVATGLISLLTERYRQINQGQTPRADLLKAVVANTASDAGRPHPDFQYGFGIMHAENAVRALELRQYQFLSLANGAKKTVRIPVPPKARQARMMIVWMDPVAVKTYSYKAPALVNDLDLSVGNGVTEFLPWVLSAQRGELEHPATRGRDGLNNIEQVTLDATELAGATELVAKIQGKRIASGASQDFVLTWWFELEDSPRVLSPAGPEVFAPGETICLHVDGLPVDQETETARTYRIELSYDNGQTYASLGKAMRPEGYDWSSVTFVLPDTALTTRGAMVRIIDSRGNVAQSPSPFTIAPVPSALHIAGTPCSQTGWKLEWTEPDPLPEHGYEIYVLDGEEETVLPIGRVDAGNSSFDIPAEYLDGRRNPYFSVAVRIDAEHAGRRARAVRGDSPAPLTIRPGVASFVEEFKRTPSPYFSVVDQGRFVRAKYGPPDLLAPAGTHLFALEHVRDTTEEKFTFDRTDFFSETNAPGRATIQFCRVDLTGIPEEQSRFFHINGALQRGANPRSDAVGFRLRVNGEEVPNQYGELRSYTNFSMPPNADGSRDYYYELPGGRVHTVSLDFASASDGNILVLQRVGLEDPPLEPRIELINLKSPHPQAHLTFDTVRVAVRNPTAAPIENIDLRVEVNGAPRCLRTIAQLGPLQSTVVVMRVDFGTEAPLGETLHCAVLAEVRDHPEVTPQGLPFVVHNLGGVIPMPTSSSFATLLGDAIVNPWRVVTVRGGEIFTDNGGALLNFSNQHAQYASFKLKPEDPNMRVRVIFREVDLDPNGSYLSVFTGPVSDKGLSLAAESSGDLTGKHRDYELVSRAEDGGMAFRFVSDRAPAATTSGWIAEVHLVPKHNHLTLLEAGNRMEDTLRNVELPVRIRVRNNWPEPIELARIIVREKHEGSYFGRHVIGFGFEEIYDRPIPPGETVIVTQGKIGGISPLEPKEVRVEFQAMGDTDPSDNMLETRLIQDRYCVPHELNPAEKPALRSMRSLLHPNDSIVLAPCGRFNRYLTDTIVLYNKRERFVVRLDAPPTEEMALHVYCDRNNDGQLQKSGSEYIHRIVSAGADTVQIELRSGGKPRTMRLRLIYAPATAEVSACLEQPLLGQVYDLALEIRGGENPAHFDLELLEASVGRGAVVLKDESQVLLAIRNNDPRGPGYEFTQKFQVGVQLNGELAFTEEVDCKKGSGMTIGSGEILRIPLSTLLRVTRPGKNQVKLWVKSPSDRYPVNDSLEFTVFMPGGELYSLAFKSITHDREYFEVDAQAFDQEIRQRGKTGLTFEFWVNLDAPQYGDIVEGANFRISALHSTGNTPDNALGVRLGNSVAWTGENTLRPGQWNHVAVVVDSLDFSAANGAGSGVAWAKAFINGERVAFNDDTYAFDIPTLGRVKVGQKINARIKDFRLWTVARSPEELLEARFQFFPDPPPELYEEVGMVAGPGADTVLYSMAQPRTLPIETPRPERLSQGENQGLWYECSELVQSLSFGPNVILTQSGKDKYLALVPHGTIPADPSVPAELAGIEIHTHWPGTSISLNGVPVDQTTKFDLRQAHKIVCRHSLFGWEAEQVIDLAFKEDLPAEGGILKLVLPVGENPGLSRDVEAEISGSTVRLRLDQETGLLGDATQAHVRFETPAGAKLYLRDRLLDPEGEVLDLSRPLTLTSEAPNGKLRHHVLELLQGQEVELSISSTEFIYGDGPVACTAHASSGGEIVFTSSNPRVATISDGQLHVGAPGETRITACQPGQNAFLPAQSAPVRISVSKAQASIKPNYKANFYQNIDWAFSWTGLKRENDRFHLDKQAQIDAFELIREGRIVPTSEYVRLPVGRFLVVPKAGASLTSDLYDIQLKEGELSVSANGVLLLTVVVQSEAGTPIEGAMVRLGAYAFVTDASGQVSIPVYPGSYEIAVEASGYGAVRRGLELTRWNKNETVKLRPAGHTLAYRAEGEGWVNGLKEFETHAAEGEVGENVSAQPAPFSKFIGWSDGCSSPHRQDLAGSEPRSEFVARFERELTTVTYRVAEGGTIVSGEEVQRLPRGETTAPVEVAPTDPENYYFAGWDDGLNGSTRTDLVVEDATYTARFDKYRELPGQNTFNAPILGEGFYALSEPASARARWFAADADPNGMMPGWPNIDGRAAYVEMPDAPQVVTALYSPRFRLTEEKTIVLSSWVRLHSYYSRDLRLEYTTDGQEWILVESLKSLEQHEFLKKSRHLTAELPFDQLVGADFIQFRWCYRDKGLREIYVWVDDVSIGYAPDPSREFTVSYRAEPPGTCRFFVAGEEVEAQTVPMGWVPRQVTAVPEHGFDFVVWSNGTRTPEMQEKLPVLGDRAVVAQMRDVSLLRLSYGVLPKGAGQILRNGEVADFEDLEPGSQSQLFEAVPNPGFQFVRWIEDGVQEARRSLKVETNTTRTAEFSVRPTHVTVRVRAKGRGVNGCAVTLGTSYQKTGSAGDVTFALPEGVYRLVLAPEPSTGLIPHAEDVRIDGETMVIERELASWSLQSLTLAVTRGGAPVPGVEIQISGFSLRTNEQGWASQFLTPGNHLLSVRPPDGEPILLNLDLAAGQHITHHLELEDFHLLTFEVEGPGSCAISYRDQVLPSGTRLMAGELILLQARDSAQFESVVSNGQDRTAEVQDGLRLELTMPPSDLAIQVRLVKPTPPEEKEDEEEPEIPEGVCSPAGNALLVSPNPAMDWIYVMGLESPQRVEILSPEGRFLFAQAIVPGQAVSLRGLPPGFYLVRVDGQTLRFVKK